MGLTVQHVVAVVWRRDRTQASDTERLIFNPSSAFHIVGNKSWQMDDLICLKMRCCAWTQTLLDSDPLGLRQLNTLESKYLGAGPSQVCPSAYVSGCWSPSGLTENWSHHPLFQAWKLEADQDEKYLPANRLVLFGAPYILFHENRSLLFQKEEDQ